MKQIEPHCHVNRFCFLFLIHALIIVQTCLADDAPEKRVLVLFPYTIDYPAHSLYLKGLKTGFSQNTNYNIKYSCEYLDLANHPNDEKYLDDTARYFKEKYREYRPDIILSANLIDHFLAGHGKDMFPGVPVIIARNDTSPTPKDTPSEFLSLYGRYDFEKTFQIIQKVRPSSKKVYIIIGDSEVERRGVAHLKEIEGSFRDKLQFVFLNKLPYEEMIAQIGKIGSDSAVLFVWWFSDVNKKSFIPVKVIQAVCRESKGPVFCTSAQYIGLGPVGGFVYNNEIFAQKVASVALDILSGKKVQDISTNNVETSEYAFDWRQLNRWKISEALLPPISRIEDREYNAWQLYEGYIITGACFLVIETALAFGLLLNLFRRRKAEKALLELNITLEERIAERTLDLKNANDGLVDALGKIKQLSGLLPICSSCKKIRDDKGYWNQIEGYITTHSEAEFSHSICPDCAKKLYPDMVDEHGNIKK
jgi:ABC-type uncharacterized transport system substrate-binding protein